MAIYHLSVKIIGRSSGRSAVAAAAYRSGECITNEWDGVTHDFRKKNWVEFTEIMLPDHAPKNFKDRKTFWNAVEAAEKSKSAQLAREFEVALPKELPHEKQVELVEQFVKQELVSKGMCVDIAIHNPPKTNDRHQPIDSIGKVTHNIEEMQFLNPHAHILCTMRPIDLDGKWEVKSQAEYICRRGLEECALTSKEYAEQKGDGWRKLYQYQTEDKKKAWLTAEEATERNLKRISKQPKTTPYGRKNPTIEFWNSEERVPEWRKAWEHAVNESLQKIGSKERVDARSYADQNLIKLPTVHLGVASINIEKRADRLKSEGVAVENIERSDIGNINRAVRSYNHFAEQAMNKIEFLMVSAIKVKHRISMKFQNLKQRIYQNEKTQKSTIKTFHELEQQKIELAGRISYFEMEKDRIGLKMEQAGKKIEMLQIELKNINRILHPLKAAELQKEILREEKEQHTRETYLQQMKVNSGVSDDRYLTEKENIRKLEETLGEIGIQSKLLKKEHDGMLEDLKDGYSMLPDSVKKEILGDDHKLEELCADKPIKSPKVISHSVP